MKAINDIKTILLLCLTLGLAPFFPEPHLWGKIKWIAGGANGMQLMMDPENFPVKQVRKLIVKQFVK